jgi:sterol desaturase/sphingolipid hydroxylase (fatty acid hydroxylase superfamily)
MDSLFPTYTKIIGVIPAKVLTAVLIFVAGHLLLERFANRDVRLAKLWPFKQIRKLRVWLWGFVILSFGVGVLGNLYANVIQKQIDQEPSSPAISKPATQP